MLRIDQFQLSVGTNDDSTRLVHDLSLSLEAGETLCIVGESGSGKTVTALSIIRLLEFVAPVEVEGGIAVAGTEVTGLDGDEMRRFRSRRIGMIFQEGLDSLNPTKRIGPQLIEAYDVYARERADLEQTRRERLRAGDAKARSLLAEVGLADVDRVMGSYPHQLSGGMQQRVMIAMALISDPSLLIADEPTTALDVTTQAEILALFRRVQTRHRMSCVFITHDMGVAAEIADRIAVMYRGRLVESGPADQILTAPQHPYSRALLECVPRVGVDRRDGFPTIDAALLAAAGTGEVDAEATATVRTVAGLSAVQQRTDTESGTGAALVIDAVTKRFGSRGRSRAGEFAAVDALSLTIEPGEFFGLVGESGSGKTTLGRMVAGLETPSAGSIAFGSHRIDERGLRTPERLFRRDVQMIFQDPQSSLDPRMTAGAIIAEPLSALTSLSRPEIRERVARLVEEVGLPASASGRIPSQLSGGQRQRVAIARAIAASPGLIVADEPTSALDVSVQGQVMNVLLALKQSRGLGFLFITHNLSLVLAVADRIGVMQRGRLVEVGTPDELIARPRHAYTRLLLDANPSLDRFLPA